MRSHSTEGIQLNVLLNPSGGFRCVFFSRVISTFWKADDFAATVFLTRRESTGASLFASLFPRDHSHVFQRHVAQLGSDA